MSQRLQLQPDPGETLKQSVMQFLRDASAFSHSGIILDLSFLARAHLEFQFPGSLLNPRLKQVVGLLQIVLGFDLLRDGRLQRGVFPQNHKRPDSSYG